MMLCIFRSCKSRSSAKLRGHFRRASQDPKNGDQAYALLRFDNEVHRIYGVMNLGLHKKRYLAPFQVTPVIFAEDSRYRQHRYAFDPDRE
jgi:hypothetical protein